MLIVETEWRKVGTGSHWLRDLRGGLTLSVTSAADADVKLSPDGVRFRWAATRRTSLGLATPVMDDAHGSADTLKAACAAAEAWAVRWLNAGLDAYGAAREPVCVSVAPVHAATPELVVFSDGAISGNTVWHSTVPSESGFYWHKGKAPDGSYYGASMVELRADPEDVCDGDVRYYVMGVDMSHRPKPGDRWSRRIEEPR
jgi:hypothetical protein